MYFFASVFFFFSSRRRHTRLQGDWSSDVCSSDLSSTRVTSNTNPATASAISSAARERGSSSAGSLTSANSSSSESRSDRCLAGSDHGKQRRTDTARSCSFRVAHSDPSERHSNVRVRVRFCSARAVIEPPFSLELHLQLVQVSILPVWFREQLCMRPVFHQPALLDHEQPRRLAQRRQPVRNREHGPPRY